MTQAGRKSSDRKSSEALTRVARLFKIVSLVSAGEGKVLGRQELAEACGCQVRTVQRDLSLLAEAGIPVDYDARCKAYRLPEKGWTFPVASLTAQDALALSLLRGLVGQPGLPQGRELRKTLDKLTGSVPAGIAALMQEVSETVQWGAQARDYGAAPLLALQEAVQRRQGIELDYVSRSRGERSWRRVDPYGVEARAGQFWELHGWCHRNGAIRTFALDQVRDMREVEAGFVVREEEWASFQAMRGVIGGIRSKEAAVSVDVLFAVPVAAYARDQRWPAGLSASDEAGGAVRLTGIVSGVSGLVAELLRWRRYCQVEGGAVLRAAMAAEVWAMAALYEPPHGEAESVRAGG